MKKYLIGGLAIVALAVAAANPPGNHGGKSLIACGDCTNSVACGGDCTNSVACGGDCTNSVTD